MSRPDAAAVSAPHEEHGFPLEFERRLEARTRCSLPVQVEHEGRAIPATIECFSRRGLLLRSPIEAAPGSQVVVHVPEMDVSVRGQVRSQMGVPLSLDGLQWGALGVEVCTLPHDLAARLEGRLG
ncbi:MAG: PilZ domain-containing protein [Myxococcota bacterium]|nr:PilZ domain-containing protein [Myxococcota bacterium]